MVGVGGAAIPYTIPTSYRIDVPAGVQSNLARQGSWDTIVLGS